MAGARRRRKGKQYAPWVVLLLYESFPAVTRLTVYRRLQVMRTVGQQATFGAKLFMASEVFFRDVLRIYLSEFGERQEKPTSGIKV